MKNIKYTVLTAALAVFLSSAIPVRAQRATQGEALAVASNWVRLIIQTKDGWGEAETAVVEEIQELRNGNRTIGYFCHVKPVGYIVISLRKELAPVKAYSARCNLDPGSEVGMADLIKGRMVRILDTIEQRVGPLRTARTEDISNILEIDYRDAWAELEGDIASVEVGLSSQEGDVNAANYQEGEVLLTTNWHQGEPFNQYCPAPPPDSDCTQALCLVGCVATAGAQIMRYWHWPPYGSGGFPYDDTYDWPNMRVTVSSTSPVAVKDAVAELSNEIGIAVGMDYCVDGCQSGAVTTDMEDVYEDHYYYSTLCSQRDRTSYTAEEWFDLLKVDLNENRPVQYRILGHSIVGDGWQEFAIGQGIIREYHMNYGWSGDTYDTWYTLDALYQVGGGIVADEYMMVNILPVTAVLHTIAGVYPQEAFNYRYFDQDASGSSATFAAGQNLQFLPNVVVSSTGTIAFGGNTRFFTRGDMSRGIRTDSGGISLYSGGQMRLY